ncbi:MAG: glycosyltransferase, partial [Methylococcales bacterium]|nr:glycosyltransferase [Methylococcales bacterium]
MSIAKIAAALLRRVLALRPFRDVLVQNWRWLKFYPPVTPDQTRLAAWYQSQWPDYQAWLNQHALTCVAAWWRLRQADVALTEPVLLTLITPVYNTPPSMLAECLLSVRQQTYPFWQWLLIDDGSTDADTLALLRAPMGRDPRICLLSQTNQGISAATNRGLAEARGTYVLFLDHDDRLSLDALSQIAHQVMTCPDTDIVYSDRDMISPEGYLHNHLFKPDWSPDTLLSGNYAFHLMAYRRELLLELGGLRP